MGEVPGMIDDDPAAQNLTTTVSGQEIDLNNLPGRRKLELIKMGEMDIDKFIAPPNMTGKKLKALRDSHREKVEAALSGDAEAKIENTFKVGDMVEFKGEIYEVLKSDDHRVMINKNKKNVWVYAAKVKAG